MGDWGRGDGEKGLFGITLSRSVTHFDVKGGCVCVEMHVRDILLKNTIYFYIYIYIYIYIYTHTYNEQTYIYIHTYIYIMSKHHIYIYLFASVYIDRLAADIWNHILSLSLSLSLSYVCAYGHMEAGL